MIFVPSYSNQNRWVTVIVCKKCRAVMAVISNHPRKYGIISWRTVDGNGDDPCQSCGAYALPTSKEIDEKLSLSVVSHVNQAVAKYENPVRWCAPWTWWKTAGWKLQPEDLDVGSSRLETTHADK